jgi:hypothetical protein
MPSQQTARQKIETGLCLLAGMAVVLYCWTMLEIHSHQLGWDFPVFYIAAHLPLRSGLPFSRSRSAPCDICRIIRHWQFGCQAD